MNQEKLNFLKEAALSYFLKYVRIDTRSDSDSESAPSSSNQLDLAEILVNDFKELGIRNAELDQYGFVYATLPASSSVNSASISFIAHMDTSPSEPGNDVKPLIHKDYKGGVITFPDDNNLTLSPSDSPELLKFLGDDIITASGKTLLGADDKAGIAAIMAAAALFCKYPDLAHPELKLVFTPDEEVGRGTDNIDTERMASLAYTIDGGELGELEAECFDAWSVRVHFTGRNVHPGSAKNVMINAGAIAARFFANLPEWETPEHSEKREGFYHLTDLKGDESSAELRFIIRDFEEANNLQRLNLMNTLKDFYLQKYPGLAIEITESHSYRNMAKVLDQYPDMIARAAAAIRESGVEVIPNAVRGGTDGARLCFMGIPTPNIFSGGLLYHSRREWIPIKALQKAAEVIVRLAGLYSK